ncbi:MAG: hypothetical protein IKR18_02575 [Bacteroidaceae bacterium]|nr:hypothetical protein [Bacteroidaceae bacterium]
MKRLLILLLAPVLIALLPMTASAQKASAESIKKLLTVSGQFDQMKNLSDGVRHHLVRKAKEAKPQITDEQAKAEAEAELDKMIDEITELTVPYYSCLSESECNELIAEMSTPKGKDIMSRINKVNEEAQREVTPVLGKFMEARMSGKTPESVKTDETTPEMKKAFDKYCNIVDPVGIFENAINGMKQVFLNSSQGANTEMIEQMINSLSDYANKNAKAIIFNIVNKSLTVDDMHYLVNLYSTPAGKHLCKANKKFSADAFNFGMKVNEIVQKRIR